MNAQIQALADDFTAKVMAAVDEMARAKLRAWVDAFNGPPPKALDAGWSAADEMAETGAKEAKRKFVAAAKASGWKVVRPSSPAQRRSRILQGRYLGALRPLKGPARMRVRVMQAKRGHEAAIRLAKKLGDGK